MNQDIQSQLDRAKELLQELEKSCNDDLKSQSVSGKTKNLAQEVLLKVRHLLDQAIYKFFEKYYFPNLPDSDRKTARVYFPIVDKKDSIKSVLGRAKMANIERDYPDFYNFLDSVQPYNSDYLWLKQLAELSSEKHIRLTPQTKTEAKRVTVSRNGGAVSWGPGVTFGRGVNVMGVPIDPRTQLPIPNDTVKTEITKWVSFLFEGTDINVLWLCKKSVEGGEKIVKKILEFV